MDFDFDTLVRESGTIGKQLKEAMHSEGAGLVAQLSVFRGNEEIACIIQPTGGGEIIAEMVAMGICSFRADAATLITDAYTLVEATPPGDDDEDLINKIVSETGNLAERFAQGDQRVRECLTITVGAADGRSVHQVFRYRVSSDGIEWDEEDADWCDLATATYGGRIPDAWQVGFRSRDRYKMLAEAMAITLALDDADAELRQDVVAVLLLGRMGCRVALFDERAKGLVAFLDAQGLKSVLDDFIAPPPENNN